MKRIVCLFKGHQWHCIPMNIEPAPRSAKCERCGKIKSWEMNEWLTFSGQKK